MEDDEKKIFDAEEVEKDPAVIQEAVRLRVRLLRLKYYQEVFKTISLGFQTFKSEAVSFVSGVGTLILGWYQLKKWILVGGSEVKKEAEGIKSQAAHTAPLEISNKHITREPKATVTIVPNQSQIQMMPHESVTIIDNTTYTLFGFILVFLVSTVMVWFKHKNKNP
jgi:hypothetical protein